MAKANLMVANVLPASTNKLSTVYGYRKLDGIQDYFYKETGPSLNIHETKAFKAPLAEHIQRYSPQIDGKKPLEKLQNCKGEWSLFFVNDGVRLEGHFLMQKEDGFVLREISAFASEKILYTASIKFDSSEPIFSKTHDNSKGMHVQLALTERSILAVSQRGAVGIKLDGSLSKIISGKSEIITKGGIERILEDFSLMFVSKSLLFNVAGKGIEIDIPMLILQG